MRPGEALIQVVRFAVGLAARWNVVLFALSLPLVAVAWVDRRLGRTRR